MAQLTLKSPQEINSLDRRTNPRINQEAEIVTFWDDARFRKAGVIESTEDGARVVLSHPVEADDTIGVVVQYPHRRMRTFARVAWTAPLNGASHVVGLEFLRLDESLAC